MEQLTEYFLTALEILEKEIKLFKLTAARTLLSLCCFVMAIFLIGVGIMLLAWTSFTAVSLLVGPVVAGLSAAVLVLAGGGVMLWIGKKSLK